MMAVRKAEHGSRRRLVRSWGVGAATITLLLAGASHCSPDDGDNVGGGSDATDDGDNPLPDLGVPEMGPPPDGLRAFPGAQGFGTETPGGRGGRVMVVDTLDWEGRGSLSEALLTPEPRIIVFRVSGVIHVGDGARLSDETSYVTVAGQTSPGGITLTGSGGAFIDNYQNDFHDGIFRFLRFRGHGNYDNISFNTAHHLVIDHCDFSGATDETFDITLSHDVTVQWSTITSSDPSGQNYGALIAYNPTSSFSFHHNFFAHHAGRCAPHMHWSGGVPSTGAIIEFSNNIIYNCSFEGGMYLTTPDEGSDRISFNLIGNYFKGGPDTPSTAYAYSLPNRSNIYETDTRYPGYEVWPDWDNHDGLSERVAAAPEVTTQNADEAFELVMTRVGAFPRDALNARTVDEARNGTGRLGNFDDELLSAAPEPPPDADLDGMPDDWESAIGLDPNDPSDAAGDHDDDGYTNIEEYINQLADALIPR